jgi:HlyD family secretion protein
MSITTTPAPTQPVGGTQGGGFLARFRRERDTTPVEMLDFFSPCAAVMARPANPLARNTVLVIGTLVLTIVVLLWVLTVDREVQAGGKVVSLTPETVVQSLNAGIVKTIAVNVGDVVRKGQLLAQLDPTFAASDNNAAREMTDRYQTEVDRLSAEVHGVPYRPRLLTAGALVQEGIYAQRAAARDAELRYYKGQIDAERALQAQAEANVRQYAKETGVSTDAERIYEQLEHDQVGSHLNTLTAQNQRLEAERFVLTNIEQARSAQQTVAALQGQLDNYNQQWFADISQNITDDSVQLATVRDQLEHAALNYKLIDLRAEDDSIVLSVAPVSPGSILQAGQTFFTLVPVNAPLEVDAQISGNESGFVAVGQEAQIQFQTFPFTAFGEGRGSVRLMSADSFNTGSTGASNTTSAGTTSNAIFTGQNPNSAYYYDARITIDRLKLKNLPKDFHVVPGMPVSIAIAVGTRNIWEYLIERLLPVWYEGMREPV